MIKYSSLYLGAVAGGRLPSSKYSNSISNYQLQSRVQHYARAQMRGAKFKYCNYYGPGETGSGAAITLHASVEYPKGTFTRVTFSGADNAVIADGADVLSDALSIDIPDGALFWEWTHLVTTTGALYSSTTNNVDICRLASSVTDVTLTGVTTGMSGTTTVYQATAIIGLTDKPSVLIIGDSRECGAGSYTAYGSNDIGTAAKPLGGSFGYICIAASGAALWQYTVSSTAKLKGLAAYCTHVIIGGGINDLNGGDTAATLKTNLQSVITDYNPGTKRPVFLLTVAPYTTSTDSWATETNQTIWDGTKNGNRNTHNANIRGGLIVGQSGFFDVAAKLESVANAGKWFAPGYTGDGLHATLLGDLASMPAVMPSFFGSKAYIN